MDLFSLVLIAIGLAADCFAVAISSSMSQKKISLPQILRVALSFGVFQAIMPVIGWFAGRTVVDIIAAYDHWVAAALLWIVGGRMLWESFGARKKGKEVDISKGLMLITLSLATSIDALAVGLSFAFLKVNIAFASSVIGIVAFLVTVTGFMLGMKIGKFIGRHANAIGGIILVAIGIRILISHTS